MSDDWYTPSEYIESARSVMGGIALDPFSSDIAQITVGAGEYLTLADDAFKSPWKSTRPGGIWMNPPFSRGNVDKAISAFLKQRGNRCGVVLVSNSTETKWFQMLLKHCECLCLPDHRIKFADPNGSTASGHTRGQVLFYFGSDTQRFANEFKQYGIVVKPL